MASMVLAAAIPASIAYQKVVAASPPSGRVPLPEP